MTNIIDLAARRAAREALAEVGSPAVPPQGPGTALPYPDLPLPPDAQAGLQAAMEAAKERVRKQREQRAKDNATVKRDYRLDR